jgi:hypothetical protein
LRIDSIPGSPIARATSRARTRKRTRDPTGLSIAQIDARGEMVDFPELEATAPFRARLRFGLSGL